MEKKKALTLLASLSQGTPEAANTGVQKMEIVSPQTTSCQTPAPTVSNNINVGNLKNGEGDVISFDITNGSPGALRLFFGLGLFNRTGTPAQFGVNNASVDEPLCTDDFGAGTAKMEFFSEFTNGHSYIADSIKIFSFSAAQGNVNPSFATITPNGDFLEVRARNTEVNSDLNYTELVGCHIPLTFYQGVSYLLGAGENITAEVNVLGVDMIGNFSGGLSK